MITPAHLLALPDPASISYHATDDDGTERLVAHGMRLLQHTDGSIERARQLLPAGSAVRTLELPERLGHGYVFYVRSSSSTLVWRSSSWTGPLEPLANVDFAVASIVAGFDRLYLVDRVTQNIVAIDARTGKVTDSGALPPSPTYGSMAIADAWTGAVSVPYRGVLATFDAGTTWHPVTAERSYGMKLDHGQIEMRLASGSYVLDASGVLRKHELGSSDSVFRGAARDPSYVSWVDADQSGPEPPATPPPGPLGRRPLDLAVLRGFPDSSTSAVVAADGALGRVRLSDGKLLDAEEHALPRGATCDGIPLGSSFGFVCGQHQGKTTVYAFKPPLGLSAVLSFDEPRYVAASGNGALVVRGGCSGHASDNPGAYCIRSREARKKGDPRARRPRRRARGRSVRRAHRGDRPPSTRCAGAARADRPGGQVEEREDATAGQGRQVDPGAAREGALAERLRPA